MLLSLLNLHSTCMSAHSGTGMNERSPNLKASLLPALRLKRSGVAAAARTWSVYTLPCLPSGPAPLAARGLVCGDSCHGAGDQVPDTARFRSASSQPLIVAAGCPRYLAAGASVPSSICSSA
jgi:hypothetical protein